MNAKTGESNQKIYRWTQWIFSRRGVLSMAGALLVLVAILIGFNARGLRGQLLSRITTPHIDSLALLPLENLSRDPGQEYVAQMMTNRLITQLQRFGTFRVIAPPSVVRYKKAPKPLREIAQELSVSAVIQGGVLRSGDRIQIGLNLIDVPTNRRLWGQNYDRLVKNEPGLEAEIARAIAAEIKATIGAREEKLLTNSRTVNPEAFDALLRAGAVMMSDLSKSEVYTKQAIQLEPEFPDAYIGLATNYYMRNMFPKLPPRDTYPAVREAAQRAITLDPTHPAVSQPHRLLALVALEYDWDIAGAEKEFKSALETAPLGAVARHMYAHFLLSTGRMQEAAAESQRAMNVDPTNAGLIACVSWHDIAERNYEQAEKRALQALSLGAPDQLARLTLGWSYGLRGRHEEAIEEFQKAVVGWKDAVFPTAVLGHAYAAAGKQDAAREVLDRLLARSKTEYVSPYEIAMIYAGLGERDRAFEWLEKAYDDRASLLVYFRMDPRIWTLRSDPRFRQLLRRMNFPEDRQF